SELLRRELYLFRIRACRFRIAVRRGARRRGRRGRLEAAYDERDGLLRREVNDADGVVVGVGDVETSARYGESARLVERTLRAVRLSGLARPCEGLDGSRARVEHFDLVVVRV